jgi:NAD-dependent SIR2 family protein deacetylase
MPNIEIGYTPGEPVYQPPLFCNRDVEIALILDSLRSRRMSCAVVAGVNMGKTSLLRHLECILADELSQAKRYYGKYFIPAYVEVEIPSNYDHPHLLRQVLLNLITQAANKIGATVSQCLGVQLLTDAPQWELGLPAKANQDPFREFEADLLLITQEIDDQLGQFGVIRPVLLIDEVHRVADSRLQGLNVRFARALVRLLDTPHLRVPFVLACTRPVSEQLPTEDDKQLAYKIDCVPLPVLPRDGCSHLVYEPLKSIYGLEKSELLPKEVEAAIYRETGGHPFFMHYIMSEICTFEDLSQVQVYFIEQKTESMSSVCREYAKAVMYQISEHDLSRQIFDRLCQSGGELSHSAIEVQFPGYEFMLADALNYLKCLGVLREVTTGHVYAVTGELFKRWFVSESLRREAEKPAVSFRLPELRQLVKRINQGDCILFVGSGVSIEANLPSTGKLIAELASEIDYPLKGGESLAVISQYVEDKLGRDRLLNFLEERLFGADIADSHRLIPKILWAAVYTTNYDTLIEEGYRQSDRGWRRILRSADFTAEIKPDETLIVKLHGCLTAWRSQETRPIITEDDYQKYSDNRHALFAKLRSDLFQKVVLFIGFGLTDRDFQQVYAEVKKELGELQHLSYAVMPDCDEFAQRHWRKNNVFLVKATARDFLTGLLDYVK